MIQESFDDWSKYTNLNFREANGNEHGDGVPFPSNKRVTYAHAWMLWQPYRG